MMGGGAIWPVPSTDGGTIIKYLEPTPFPLGVPPDLPDRVEDRMRGEGQRQAMAKPGGDCASFRSRTENSPGDRAPALRAGSEVRQDRRQQSPQGPVDPKPAPWDPAVCRWLRGTVRLFHHRQCAPRGRFLPVDAWRRHAGL